MALGITLRAAPCGVQRIAKYTHGIIADTAMEM